MNQIQRRSFLNGALGAGAFSAVASQPVFAGKSNSSSGKVWLACCDIGNQGGTDINSLHATGLCKIVEHCDRDMGAPVLMCQP